MGQFIHPSSHLLPPPAFFFHITKFVGGVDKTGKRVIAVLSGNRVKASIFLQFPSTESNERTFQVSLQRVPIGFVVIVESAKSNTKTYVNDLRWTKIESDSLVQIDGG